MSPAPALVARRAKKSAERYAEDCAVDERLRDGRVNRGDSQRAAGGSDEEADGCQHEETGLRGVATGDL